MAKRKYTRKQLRQPDEFITFSMKAWQLLRDQAPRVIVMLVVAVVIIAAVWTWSYFSNARAAKATDVLTRAMEIVQQTLVPPDAKIPPPEDGIPRFKTHKEKLQATEKELSEAVAKSRGSLRAVAVLLRGSTRYDLGQYDQAIQDFEQYLAQGENKLFELDALQGVGYCYEARKEWDKALAAFRKLPRDGDKKWIATYHEARILAKKGQKKEASTLLEQVVAKATDATLRDWAGDQLALVKSK